MHPASLWVVMRLVHATSTTWYKRKNTTQKTKKKSNSEILDINRRKNTQNHDKTRALLQTTEWCWLTEQTRSDTNSSASSNVMGIDQSMWRQAHYDVTDENNYELKVSTIEFNTGESTR
jgi:hypothetical protein